MLEKAQPWAPPAAVSWEGCVGAGKDKSSRLRSKLGSNRPRKRSYKRSYKNTSALLALAWMHGATA
jgi:hypothetical protein